MVMFYVPGLIKHYPCSLQLREGQRSWPTQPLRYLLCKPLYVYNMYMKKASEFDDAPLHILTLVQAIVDEVWVVRSHVS